MKSILFGLVFVLATGPAAYAGAASTDPGTDASPQEACMGDNPLPCLNQHGEAAARLLAKTYADTSAKLDAACSEVISPGESACLERADAMADKALNDTYQHAMASITAGPDGKNWRVRLKASQEAWLRFRDADCGDLTVLETGSGSITGAMIFACRLGKTEARTAELKQRYERQ